MYLIIIGSGRTGKHVIQSAIDDGHEVVVIENNETVAQWAASHFDCLVINDEGSSLDVLKEAGADKADALIATTNDDAVNLLITMLGRDLGIEKLVSSVTNEDHIRLFKELGVNTVENPFRLNGQFLYRAVQQTSVKDFMDLGDGVEIIEFVVSHDAIGVGRSIKDISVELGFPKESHVVGIKRDHKLIIPHGSTVIEAGDIVLVLTLQGSLKPLLKIFGEEK